MMNLISSSIYYDVNTEIGQELEELLRSYLPVFIAISLIISIAVIVLQILAAVRVSKAGGSGAAFFFFGWIYVACSDKANNWENFSKITAVILGLLTGIGLPIYVLAVLKAKNTNSPAQATPTTTDNLQNENSKIDILKKLRADGTLSEEEYKQLVIKELEK